MKLRVKDLQNYLGRRKINIKSCVEKKDLVELVLQTNGDIVDPPRPPRVPPSRSWEDNTIRVSDQVPLERSSNFPRSYVESSHRREFFEKFANPSTMSSGSMGSSEDAPEADMVSLNDTEDLVTSTRVEPMEEEVTLVHSTGEVTAEEEVTLIQSFHEDELIEVTEVEEATSNTEQAPTVQPHDSDGAIGGRSPPVQEEAKGPVQENQEPAQDNKQEETVEDNINEVIQDLHGSSETRDIPTSRLRPDLLSNIQTSRSVPSSPRRFANQGVVYLTEIQSASDLKELSAKQAKEILAMNRVNFKGCVEKEELLKIVERLWKQDRRSKEELDTMDDDSVCKICMDAPIDCVMLECGHMCTCTNCGKQMAECPICRQYVIRVVRTFKA